MWLNLLAIDPGQRTGWAFFALLSAPAGLRLLEAGVNRPIERAWPMMKVDHKTIVVIEKPVIYPGSQARPADIMKLRGVAAQYEERFHMAGKVQLVEPRAWKGTIDGDIFLRRIEAAMTEYEQAVLAAYKGGYRHNAVDAIGLGKWAARQPWVKAAA